MTDTLNTLRAMENKLDEMDQAMEMMRLIFEQPERDKEKGD